MQISSVQIRSKPARNSSLEVLRIIAMLFIVLSHACNHSDFDCSQAGMSLNKLFIQWGCLGHIGSGIFMLITGYFMCNRENSYKPIIRLWLQVWFYSLLLFVICRFGFQVSYSTYELFTVFLPAIFQEYWFFTVYIVIYMLRPYINIFLEHADRISLRNLIIVMSVLWVLIPTFTLQSIFGSSLIQMLFYYIVGAYIRLYPDHILKNKAVIIGLTIASFFFLFASTFVFDYLGELIDLFRDKGGTFYTKESLLIVMCTIGLFVYFVNIRPFSNRIIDAISACTFGVYLIHDNPAVRKLLWLRFFRHAECLDSKYLIVNILISVLLVFCISSLIEYLRICILDKHFNRLARNIDNKLNNILMIHRRGIGNGM